MKNFLRQNLIFGIWLGIILVSGSIFVKPTNADSILHFLRVKNAPPQLEYVYTATWRGGTDNGGVDSTGVNLIEDSTVNVYLFGRAIDNNGCQQLSLNNAIWSAKIFRNGATENAGPFAYCTRSDNNDCYMVSESYFNVFDCEGPFDVDAYFEGWMQMYYYADATDSGQYQNDYWVTRVDVQDPENAVATAYDYFEIASLVAADEVNSELNYGTVDRGAISGSVPLGIENTGNRPIDIRIKASGDMYCDGINSALIPVENIHWSLDNGQTFEFKRQLDDEFAVADISLPARKNENTGSITNIYWQLKVPQENVRGNCYNTIIIEALLDNNASGSSGESGGG